MEEQAQFSLLLKSSREEEKCYYFDDPDEEKISFGQYRRSLEAEEHMFMGEEDRCSDCDKDCQSKLLADLPTNDSNSYIYEAEEEENNATKFLTRIGLLEKIDNDDIFNLVDLEYSEQMEDDYFEFESLRCRRELSLKSEKEDKEIRLDFDDLDDECEIDLKHKELIEEGLPLIPIDDTDTFHCLNCNSVAQRRDSSVISQDSSPTKNMELTRQESSNREESILIELRKSTERKKSTEFNHLLERKTFRMLRKYFKNSFENFAEPSNFKKRVRSMRTEEIDRLVVEYIRYEFDFLANFFEGNELAQMIISLKRIILSDRFNKPERVVQELDFANTRDLFNKYSKRTRNEWLRLPTNSILLIHFYLKHGKHQSYAQKDVSQAKLHDQMCLLVKLCFEYLPAAFVEIYSHESCKINHFLN